MAKMPTTERTVDARLEICRSQRLLANKKVEALQKVLQRILVAVDAREPLSAIEDLAYGGLHDL